MRYFCYIVPYEGSKISSFLTTQACLSSQKMDEHCNYQTHKGFAFISKRIRQVHRSAVGLPAVPAGGYCPCRWASCWVPCTPLVQFVSTAPGHSPHVGSNADPVCSGDGWKGCGEAESEQKKQMANAWVVRRGMVNEKCPEQGRVGWKIQWEVKNTGNVVDEGKHCPEQPCENLCVAQRLVATTEDLQCFRRIPHWWGWVQARIYLGVLYIYISASNSRSDCNELNECGTRDVSGRRQNVGFLLCIIRTLGSWVSFNCHPKLLILPKNEECEESYWFPSGQTIYFLVLISLMCVFIPCHCCDQAKAAFIGRFQVGFQLNMWLELQSVNGKNWLTHQCEC